MSLQSQSFTEQEIAWLLSMADRDQSDGCWDEGHKDAEIVLLNPNAQTLAQMPKDAFGGHVSAKNLILRACVTVPIPHDELFGMSRSHKMLEQKSKIKDASVNGFSAVLRTFLLEKSHDIKQNGGLVQDDVVHDLNYSPVFLVSHREFVSRREFFYLSETNEYVILQRSYEGQDVKPNSPSNTVRATMHFFVHRIRQDPSDPSKRAFLDTMSCIDMNGSIPSSIVNTFSKKAQLDMPRILKANYRHWREHCQAEFAETQQQA